MKRKWFVAVGLMLMTVFSLGQGVTTLTFTGKDTNNVPVQLNSVLITNHTQRWQEVLCYPDTVLVLGESGIEIEEEREHFKVYQNHPNPFDGTTEFLVQLDDQKKVSLEIYDITGR